MNGGLDVSIFFLIITIIIILILFFYLVFWKPTVPATYCNTDNDCGLGQVCSINQCVEIICSSNSNCENNGLCINSYCTPYSCQIGNDCPTGMACINNTCVKAGSDCQDNYQCSPLSCLNQKCVQCLSNSTCPIGQGCFTRTCRYPYLGDTGTNLINFPSPAQFNGNITAPPGYFCSGTICGTGTSSGGNLSVISCTGNNSCPISCPFCINSVCRCTSGAILEECRNHKDCSSGLCDYIGSTKFCVPIGGECVFNYNGIGGINFCPASKPYCVNGTCYTVSLGAVCGSYGLPPDLCNNPQSLGVVGTTGVSNDGMGFFCVNGTCQQNPGILNSLCTTNSCSFIQSGAYTCVPVSTPSITQMRCLTT